jgi:hypothetical protein
VHAPCEEESGNSKDNFYEKLEQVFDHIPKYHTKILLGDLNVKIWRERERERESKERGRVILNGQLGMRVFNRIVMMMVLEE